MNKQESIFHQYKDISEIGCVGNINAIHGVAIIEAPVRFWGDLVGTVSIGAFSYAQGFTTLCDVDIGRFCSLAFGVTIGPGEHPLDWLSSHPFVCSSADVVIGFGSVFPDYQNWLGAPVTKPRVSRRVVIGSDVWIGHNAVIRQGVTIGHGAVIGANAVVTRDVAPYSIVGGVPARHIRYRFNRKLRKELLELKFWNYDLTSLTKDIDYSNIESSISLIKNAVQSGQVALIKNPRYRLSGGAAVAL